MHQTSIDLSVLVLELIWSVCTAVTVAATDRRPAVTQMKATYRGQMHPPPSPSTHRVSKAIIVAMKWVQLVLCSSGSSCLCRWPIETTWTSWLTLVQNVIKGPPVLLQPRVAIGFKNLMRTFVPTTVPRGMTVLAGQCGYIAVTLTRPEGPDLERFWRYL